MFQTHNLIQKTQKYDEINSLLLPVCSVVQTINASASIAVGSWVRSVIRSLVFFNYMSIVQFLNLNGIPSFKFQLLCIVILTRKETIFWAKDG
jgi:hypothetical protein